MTLAGEGEVRRRARYVLTLAPDHVILRTRREIGLLPFGVYGLWLAFVLFPWGLPLLLSYVEDWVRSLPPTLRDWLLAAADRRGTCSGALLGPMTGLVGLWALQASFRRKEFLFEREGPLRVFMHRFNAEPQEWTVPRAHVGDVRVERDSVSVGDERWLVTLSDRDAQDMEDALCEAVGRVARPPRERPLPSLPLGLALFLLGSASFFLILLWDLWPDLEVTTRVHLGGAFLLCLVWVKPVVRGLTALGSVFLRDA